ncbi:hypothetical protein ACH4OY_31015 [Micromonospora rubida]|uniref:Uncharacterized protein n=1 Tax=Micromonospora rubida TaxID=2697657 RepID=A0ABW7SXR0_9ACTN
MTSYLALGITGKTQRPGTRGEFSCCLSVQPSWPFLQVVVMPEAASGSIRHYLTGADVPDPWGKEAADSADCAALIGHGTGRRIA